ncbi:MAG: hypothetical protein SFV15_05145 [Polyangiaceae bacterium]|nr:hypothetical protein [Polyangiaceae bacterium]
MENSRMKAVYVITERNENKYWNRVGVAFVNRDGSLNVRLEALPITGELHIRDFVAKDEFAGPSARGFGGGAETLPIAKSA